MRDTDDHWPEGYERQILARWGDALFADSPEFDIATLDGKAAERQFGYNNDFTQFLPLPWGEKSSNHGLMVVSHEYATPFLMFPGLTDENYREKLTQARKARWMSSPATTRNCRTRSWSSARAGTRTRTISIPSAASSRASSSRKSRTNGCVSTGWSRSTRSIPLQSRSSAPRSAA
ncbi:DUF839 domain-containing protein [Rhizobium sp. 25PS6]|nr:alkaline phosphatase PhoX [Rhizobium sp. 25PS6]MDU0365206.1 DUF839 domain-containing protein [Rhizobium sp. 25PS6]